MLSLSLPHTDLSDVLLCLKINGIDSPLRVMGVARRSQAFLAQAAPLQPDKPPVLRRRDQLSFAFRK